MSGLLIAAPLRLEAFMISRGGVGREGFLSARIYRTGVGPRRARAAVQALARDPADALLVLGFGGGLAPDSQVGEVVVADEVNGPDGTRVSCAPAAALAGVFEARGFSVCRGTVSSVARPALGKRRVQLRERGAIAVDMESAWLAAAARGRPFAVVRVLSDTPTRELTRPLLTLAGVMRASVTLRRVAATLSEWVP
jgi:4-hydroxy-3-methylbut-2-en-1-yl diphosphate reductase